MKKGIRLSAALLAGVLAALLAGCSLGSKNENLGAGMEAVAALEYDNALASFEAARAAGEDLRLACRIWERPCMRKLPRPLKLPFLTAMAD